MNQLIYPVATASLLASMTYAFSDLIFLNYLKLSRALSGMRVKYIERRGGKGVWCYAEVGKRRSDQPSFMFLHGFGGDKDTWPNMVKHLADHHCIVLDLPGHGDSSFVEGLDHFSIFSYVQSIREFIEIMGLDQQQIYLVGCSFGGVLASLYAHDYAEHIYKLGLLAPGFKTPVYTKVSEELVQGKFEKFVPSSSKDLATMIDLYCCSKPQYYSYPEVMLEAVMRVQYSPEQQEFLRNLLSNCVFEQDSKFETDFKVKIKSIKTKTIIIWGENDEMIHISGAYQLRDLIQNSELKILKNCNHMIHLDQPQKAIKHLLDFF